MPTSRKSLDRDPGRFYALPWSVLNSPAYLSLSAHARMLLMDMLARYDGSNNGDLSISFEKYLRARGWKSETTATLAKKELLNAQFIFQTRQGKRPNTCSLFALTWYRLDDDVDGKFDVRPSSFIRGAYKHFLPENVPKKRKSRKPRAARIAPPGVVESAASLLQPASNQILDSTAGWRRDLDSANQRCCPA